MNNVKAIEVLKQAANKSQAIDAMMHDFALRERARSQVTLRAFYNRMKKAGFKHSSQDYAEGLKILAECGFGELRYNKRANVVGLFGVRTTLQSIGQAVIGKKRELKNYAPRNKYSPLKAEIVKQVDAKQAVIKSLGGVEKLVRTILNDTSVDADTRVQAALVLMGEKHV